MIVLHHGLHQRSNADLAGRVGGAVIDHHHLGRRSSLGEKGPGRVGDGLLVVVRGDDRGQPPLALRGHANTTPLAAGGKALSGRDHERRRTLLERLERDVREQAIGRRRIVLVEEVADPEAALAVQEARAHVPG